MTTTRIYRLWRDRFTEPTLTRSLQNQAAKTIWPLACGYSPGGARTNLTTLDADALLHQFKARVRDGNPIMVPAEQVEIGRRWLDQQARRKAIPPGDYLGITAFAWTGCTIIADTGWRTEWAPTYEADLPDGRHLIYTPCAWQGNRFDAADLFSLRERTPA